MRAISARFAPSMRACLLATLVALFTFTPCPAQTVAAGIFARGKLLFRSVKAGGVTYRYEVYVPAAWTKQKKWPVILFLHGVGHRGNYPAGSESPVLGPLFLSYPSKLDALVVLPRVPEERFWTEPEMEALALGALDQTIREFNGDAKRVTLTGLSMGGYGVWYLASRHPSKFAAIAPICGGIRTPAAVPIPPVSTAADPYVDVAKRIGKTPVWVFHGSADNVIDVTESRRMVAALKATGGDVRYTEYEGVGHNSWDRAYAEPDFFPWLFSHRLRQMVTKKTR